MDTKYIIYKNFNNKNKKLNKKKFNNFLNFKILIQKYPLLKSLTNNYNYSFKKKYLLNFKKFNEFNLIGMGGSILGAQAIYDFLNHKIKKKFFFFNNLQKYKITKSNKKRLNIIISKSGNTLETICNSNIFLKDNQKNIIISELQNNYLNKLAADLKSDIIEHKNYIGGRYSVLSEVGMIPAELMGLNVIKFKQFNYLIKNKIFVKELLANVQSIYLNVKKGKFLSFILNYDPLSEPFFKWYQQLVSESLGKNSKGIFPIISTMPKDNHSMLQLYLSGFKSNFYTFYIVEEKNSSKLKSNLLLKDFNFLKQKKTFQILNAQRLATEQVFRSKKIPFRSFYLKKRSEETLGELFCFFTLEVILLSHLLKVDPLNQPEVELVKKETFKILQN